MAYSDPRTWVTGELVTAALMNAQLRDNLDAVIEGTTGAFSNAVTGPHVVGGSTVDYVRLGLTGAFTSGGASTVAFGTYTSGVLTGHSGDSGAIAGIKANNSVVTAGNCTTIAQLWVSEPQITVGAGTVTNSAAVYIEGAATEATNDYALWVDAGATKLDGTLAVVGDVTVNTSDLFIDTSENAVVIGHTAIDGQGRALEVLGTTSDSTGIELMRFSANAEGPSLAFAKSRGGAIGTEAIVQDDDNLGAIYWFGDDGTDQASYAARIAAEVDGTPGSNDMPGRLVFSTTADGAVSPTARMTIDAGGTITAATTSAMAFAVDDNSKGLKYNGTVDGLEYRGFAGHIWMTGTDGANEKMRLTANGLGVYGSNTAVAPEAVLHSPLAGTTGGFASFTNVTDWGYNRWHIDMIGVAHAATALTWKGYTAGYEGSAGGGAIVMGRDVGATWATYCNIMTNSSASDGEGALQGDKGFMVTPSGMVQVSGGPDTATSQIKMNPGNQSMDDDASFVMSVLNAAALISVTYSKAGQYRGALFWAEYHNNGMVKIADPDNAFDTADTDAKFCCYKTAWGSGDVTVKNRTGGTALVAVQVIRMQGL